MWPIIRKRRVIQSLETKSTVESKNIIKQVYELLKHLLNKLTSKGRYRNFVQELETKWRNAYRNTTMQQATNNLNGKNNFSKRMGGYFAEINTSINDIGKFKINNYDNLKEVKKKVFDYYKDSYISNEQISKPIENIDTGLKIEIWKSGINETFGNANYYKNLSLQDKKIKLATMDSLAKMIKYGEVRAKNTTNYHNAKSTAMYYYLEHPIIVVGTQYMVNMDIRKVPETNGRFYIHSINTKKIGTTGNSKSRPLTVPTSIDNISQSDTKVNRDISTKYSMQLNENNVQELDNSSFYFADAKQYDDLIKTNHIEYFRKDNGDVKVYLMDSNNNLLNEFSLWSNTNAVKELGENLGNKIYETATDTNQTIRIGNDINNLDKDTDYFMNHRPSESYGNASNFEENMPGVFEHPEWYLNLDEKYNKESLNVLKKVRNNPETELTIYRATPGNKINIGDWVTPSKSYAEYHNNTQFNGKGNILEMKVKAKDILFAGDDL